MNKTFLFWLCALYTVALFGVQIAEFSTAGRVSINVSTANAFYLALLSAYVGSKEVQRWTIGFQPGIQTGEEQAEPTPFRPRGEWFVGLWAVFLLIAVLGSELWPAKLAYPKGLTLIAFEVLGFYIGSSASKWLSERQEQKTHKELEQQLEAESTEKTAPVEDKAAPKRLTRKRERYEQQVLTHARTQEGGITREQTENLLRLSRAAANRLLSAMVQRALLTRSGDPNSPATSYKVV